MFRRVGDGGGRTGQGGLLPEVLVPLGRLRLPRRRAAGAVLARWGWAPVLDVRAVLPLFARGGAHHRITPHCPPPDHARQTLTPSKPRRRPSPSKPIIWHWASRCREHRRRVLKSEGSRLASCQLRLSRPCSSAITPFRSLYMVLGVGFMSARRGRSDEGSAAVKSDTLPDVRYRPQPTHCSGQRREGANARRSPRTWQHPLPERVVPFAWPSLQLSSVLSLLDHCRVGEQPHSPRLRRAARSVPVQRSAPFERLLGRERPATRLPPHTTHTHTASHPPPSTPRPATFAGGANSDRAARVEADTTRTRALGKGG